MELVNIKEDDAYESTYKHSKEGAERPRRGGGAGSRGRGQAVGRKGISRHDLERCDIGGKL